MENKIPAMHRTIEKTNRTIRILMDTEFYTDESKAFAVLRAAMKALRDRLTPEEAIQLASQLPALLRGFYFEGWNFKRHSIKRNKTAFLDDVRIHLHGHDELDIKIVLPPALKVILDMIDQGEAIDVLHQLPRKIQDLCPD